MVFSEVDVDDPEGEEPGVEPIDDCTTFDNDQRIDGGQSNDMLQALAQVILPHHYFTKLTNFDGTINEDDGKKSREAMHNA